MTSAVRVGYGPELEDYNLSKKFTVKFSKLARFPFSPLTEAKLAAESIAKNLPGKPLLTLSGGLDSEVMALSFLEAGIDFEAVTLRFSGGINEDEIRFSREFCRAHNIKQNFFDLNVIEFIEFGGYKAYQDKYFVPAIECCAHLWLVDQVRDNLVWGGEAFRLFHKGKGVVLQSISEIEAVIHRFMEANHLKSVPNFHFSSVELAWSFFIKGLQKNYRHYSNDHVPEFLTEKFDYYEDCGFKLIRHPDRKIKLHGFEGVRRYFDLNLANKGLPDYDHTYRIPFNQKYPYSLETYVDLPKNDEIAMKILRLEI